MSEVPDLKTEMKLVEEVVDEVKRILSIASFPTRNGQRL